MMSWTSSSRSSSNSISPVSSRSYLAKLRGASGFRNGFGRWSDEGASLVDTRNCRAAGARVVDDLAEDVVGAALRFRQRHLRRLQEPHEEAHELELVHAVRPERRDARRGRGPHAGRRGGAQILVHLHPVGPDGEVPALLRGLVGRLPRRTEGAQQAEERTDAPRHRNKKRQDLTNHAELGCCPAAVGQVKGEASLRRRGATAPLKSNRSSSLCTAPCTRA